ncbi:beta-propeller fold lactonase family protein [Pseudoalteromonas sp. T1lg48]|uniref:beta-propeller fold lactonase family protein n=1 Tax=Pseudoalteromonas sp. T1lg48 TaxID=2077100 RepID=UPI000CF68F7B|nr:beta-propeller fold lactonase family protein [Pseudoalteromonas sp. T1lg48]
MFTRACFITLLILSFNTYSKSINHITTKTDGKIDKAIDVAISNDDRFVYVAGFSNSDSKNDLVVFKRDLTNGTLSAVQSVPDSFSLLRVYELLLSRDQKNVYALEEDGDQLSVLTRDNETGMLSEIQNISSFDFPEANLSNTTVLAESNDGKYILVSGGALSISVFKRQLDTGVLEFVNLYEIGPDVSFSYEVRDLKFSSSNNFFYIAGPSGIAVFSFNESNGDISHLWTANGYNDETLSTIQSSWEVAVNEVTNDVYLASKSGLHVFSNNLVSGQLQLKQHVEIAALNATLINPRKIEINNSQLYLVVGEDNNYGSFDKNGVIQFDIDGDSGFLTQNDAIFNGVDVELMHGPMDIEFTASGEHAYVPSYLSGTLLAFTPDEANGNLSYHTVTNAEDGVRGITSPLNITASDDDKFLYVSDRISGISVFEFSEQLESLKFIQNNSPYNVEARKFDTSLVLSPDGKHIYLPENGTYPKVHLFERSSETGKVTLIKTFNAEQNWINDFDEATSFVMSADGNYMYASHSNSNWLLTVLARDPVTGDLTLVERFQNNIYGNTEGISEFQGAVYITIMPDNKHLILYSNNYDLALFSIERSTGKLTLKQLMENELFGVSKSGIATSSIGVYGNTLYLPYDTRNDYSWIVDSGIVVAELNPESSMISQIHRYSSNEQSREWLQGITEITLDSLIGRIYLTKDYGDSFIALRINDATKELSFIEEIKLKGTVLKEQGQPILVNTFHDGKYIVSTDSFNQSVSLFRKNTPPEFNGGTLDFKAHVGEYLLIDFENHFSDYDNDPLIFEVIGNTSDWMNVGASYIDGTPGSTDLGATLELNVSDGVDKISTEISIEVINTEPKFIGSTSSYNVHVNEEININFDELFEDVDNDTLDYEVNGTLPSWLTFDERSLQGTPGSRDLGATFQIEVSDGVNQISTEISIEVINTEPKFIGSTSSYNVHVNEEININFDELFEDVDNDTLDYEVNGTLPSWLTFAEKSLKGTPTISDVNAQFTLIVFDGVNNIEVPFAVNVIKPSQIGGNEDNKAKSGGAFFDLMLFGLIPLIFRLINFSTIAKRYRPRN